MEFSRPVELFQGVWVESVDTGKPVKVPAGRALDAVSVWLEGDIVCVSTGLRSHISGPLVMCWYCA